MLNTILSLIDIIKIIAFITTIVFLIQYLHLKKGSANQAKPKLILFWWSFAIWVLGIIITITINLFLHKF